MPQVAVPPAPVSTGQNRAPTFQEEILAFIPTESRPEVCIQCGTCGGSCPSAVDMDHSPRQIFALVRADMYRHETYHSGLVDELDHADASLQQACVGGISLMALLVGYRRAIIVDAIIDPEDVPSSVWCRPLSAVETQVASHLDSSHDAPLPAAIEAVRAMGAGLPSDIDIVGIVIERGEVFGEELSDDVAAAVPVAAAEVVEALQRRRLSSPLREPVHA